MRSVFHRLVTKEDHFTQLLVNLMQRAPEFRSGILGFLLSHSDDLQVEAEQIHTQRHVGELGDCGRPDINISSDQLRVFIEVKVDPGCGLTQNQQLESDSTSELKNYVSALTTSPTNGCKKILVYLVPRDWAFLPELMESIQSQSGILRTKAVNVYTKHWEDILAWLNDSVVQIQNPLVNEFRLLLQDHFGPVALSKEDVEMLFSQEYVKTWAAMQKLQSMIDEIERRANRTGYVVSSTHRKDEYGLYFSTERGREPLWFGTWYQFLDKHGSHLCFGIQTSKASAAMKSAFDAACNGNTTIFMGYMVGSFNKEAVESAETVWGQLAPVLDRVLGGPGHSR